MKKFLVALAFATVLALIGFAPARAASSLVGCTAGQMVMQNSSGGPLVCIKGVNLTLVARAVNIAATGDQGLISIPAGVTKYQLLAVQVTNCSVIPVLAQMNVNTLANSGGTSLVDNATITGATSAGVILSRTLTVIAQTNALIATSLFVNMGTANVAAGTCDVYATIRDLT